MHNPTRRAKRPLSSTRPLNRDARILFVPVDSDGPTSSSNWHVRHRHHPAQPDALRGAMLVALIVVTVVLYFILWELERASFASVPRANLTLTRTGVDSSTPYPRLDEGLNVPKSRDGASTSSSRRVDPAVTRVSNDNYHDTQANTHQDDTMKSEPHFFDAAHCNGGPCRFLLPVRIGEQESKARLHMMQLLELARRLGRTIVLPNVGKSRMSACSQWPFGAYYDTSVRSDASIHDRDTWPLAIELQGFVEWIDGRAVAPNSFVVSMDSVRQDPSEQGDPEYMAFLAERRKVDPKMLSCLDSKLARLRSSLSDAALSISVDARAFKPDSDASDRLVNLLSSSLDWDMDADPDLVPDATMERLGYEYGYGYTPRSPNTSYASLADAHVLIIDYDLRHPLFTSLAHLNLHYAPALYDLADHISNGMGPFVGVHWRMESVPVQNLAWCAAALVSTLEGLLQDDVTGKGVRHVWLATDYPRPLAALTNSVGKQGSNARERADTRKSSTFKTVSAEHDDTMGMFVEAFLPGGDLDAWTLTDLEAQLRRYPYVHGKFDVDETLLGDSGVLGILDKLVIVQASVFVSGSAECGKTSSFSKQVVEARQELFGTERGKGSIRNAVEYFGTW